MARGKGGRQNSKIRAVFFGFLCILGATSTYSVAYKATPQIRPQQRGYLKKPPLAVHNNARPTSGPNTAVKPAGQSNVPSQAPAQPQNNATPPPDKISQQLYAVRAERQRLEAYKKALLGEFVKKHAAFLAKITEQEGAKDNQALMLAVSSKSLDDFVHGTILLNHVKYYLASKNAEFINFIKSIQKVNYCIQYYAQMEATLVNDTQSHK
jgi:hypothetical protein